MKQTLEPIIREQPFFEGLEDRHIKLITGCAKNVKFSEGKIVFREGDPANQFFLIREGQVAIEVMTPEKGFMRIQTLRAASAWLVLADQTLSLALQRPSATRNTSIGVRWQISAANEKDRQDSSFTKGSLS
jgi:hypothetical protein